MRLRLRPTYTDQQLAELYARPNDYTNWDDHRLRVELTFRFAKHYLPNVASVADLSAGATPLIQTIWPHARHYVGDFAHRPGYDFHGPIEQTIQLLPHVELFVSGETIEHLDDPDAVLREIRVRAAHLVVSTPNGETTDHNPEHYWGWDLDGVHEMLIATGWDPIGCLDMTVPGNHTQIWLCR